MDACIHVQCPNCQFEFEIPVAEALTPVVELEVKRRVDLTQQQLAATVREAAQKEDDERNRTLLSAKEKVISDLRVQIDALRRKADAGVQLLAGEVQEVWLEDVLTRAFPGDKITPVPQGSPGADVLHEVTGLNGKPAGKILWECKETKVFKMEWLAKIRQDMRAADATLCVLASSALPKDVEVFGQRDGVFVVSLRCAVALAGLLRQTLIDIAIIRASSKQGDGAADKPLTYVTGPQFRSRVSAILEASTALKSDLDSEKRSTPRRWARAQKQIDAIVQGMGLLYGDVQGLTALAEVPKLTMKGESEKSRKAS